MKPRHSTVLVSVLAVGALLAMISVFLYALVEVCL